MNPPIVNEVTNPINQRRTNITVMVQSIFHLLPPWSSDKHSQRTGRHEHSRTTNTVILLAGLRYRLLSETRVAVCPNFGSVFVLWLKGIPRKKGGARRSILMNWVTRARVSPSRRAMFAWSAPSNSHHPSVQFVSENLGR